MAVSRALAALFAALAAAASAETGPTGPAPATAEIRLAPEVDGEPALAAALRASAEDALGAFESFAAEADEPAPPAPLEFILTDVALFVSDRWISVARDVYTFTGGAHGNSGVETFLWDRAAGRFETLAPFLADAAPGGPALAALSAALVDGIAREVYEGPIDDFWSASVAEATAADGRLLEGFTLVPSTEPGRAAGLAYHFSPYEVAAYVYGAPVIGVDWRVIEPWLSAEGRALFGGAPAP
jgi:hypothetical protein